MALKSLILGLAVAVAASAKEPNPKRVVLYPGTCEASAAVMLENGMFVVGDDDQEDLFVYKKVKDVETKIAKPKKLEISKLPGLKKKADLEGAARIGDAIYWIGSHSRKNGGEEDLDRHRLFAIKVKTDPLGVEAVGKPYKTLIEDLQKDGRFDRFGFKEAAKLSPIAPGGLNIEGLAATPEGALLIGFRNPIPAGKALIIPLTNPGDVLAGKTPSFGDPIELDLGGLGIRSLEQWPAKGYVIIAGNFADGGVFRAFRWSGKASEAPKPIDTEALALLVPEAVFFDPAAPNELSILSDDGDACPEPEMYFRSRRVTLPAQ